MSVSESKNLAPEANRKSFHLYAAKPRNREVTEFVDEYDERDDKEKCRQSDAEPGEEIIYEASHGLSLALRSLSGRHAGELARFDTRGGIQLQYLVKRCGRSGVRYSVECIQRLLDNLGNSKESNVVVKKLFNRDLIGGI